MSIATLMSRFLGLARELLIAMYFGASGMTDAFWVAFRVPNMLRDLLAEGNFNSAFLPVLTEESKKSKKKGVEVFLSSGFLLLLITGFFALLIFFFSESIVNIIAPSFSKQPSVFHVTDFSIKILAFFLPLISLAAISMSFLNVKKLFFIPALAPATLNVMMILSIIFLTPVLISKGIEPVLALAIGGITGGAAQFLVQVPFLIKEGAFMKVKFAFWSNPVKKIFYRMSVGIIGVAATQINLLISTFLATGAGLGAVSYLTYSMRLFQFPVGVFGVSLSNSNLVYFSDAIKSGDFNEARAVLKKSYHLSLLLLVPATLVLFLLAEEATFLIFERGKFSNLDREMTAMALRAYLLGLPFYCIFKLIGPTFYALDKEKIPIGISIFSIIVNIIFSVSLIDRFGFVILAYGVSLSVIVNSLLQIIFLRKELNIGFKFFATKTFFSILVSGFLPFALLFFTKKYILPISLVAWWKCLFLSVGYSLIFVASFIGLLFLCGEREQINRFISKIKKNNRSN